MDVRCPQCHTLYDVDTRQLRGEYTTLQCSQCEHLFRIDVHAAQAQAPEVVENQRRWMVRCADAGDILYFQGFHVLHQWIVEGRVSRTDAISRTGKKWTLLSEIGEFMPVFQVLESIHHVNSQKQLPPSHEQPASEDGRLATERFGFSAAPSQSEALPALNATEPNIASAEPQPEPALTPADPLSRRSPTAHPPVASSHRADTPTTPRSSIPQDPNQARRPPQVQPPQASTEQVAFQPPKPNKPPSNRPGVRLQTAQFADVAGDSDPTGVLRTRSRNRSNSQNDEAWTLGEFQPNSPSRSRTVVTSYQPGLSKWLIAGLSALCVIALGLGGVYLKDPELMHTWRHMLLDHGLFRAATLESGTIPTESDDPISQSISHVALALEEATHQTRRAAIVYESVTEAENRVASAQSASLKQANASVPRFNLYQTLAQARQALEHGQSLRARSLYQKVLDHQGRHPEAFSGLGWAYLGLGDTTRATNFFRRALSLDTRFGDAYIGLGKSERQRGRLKDALNAYSDYLKLFPNGPKASIARYQSDQLRQDLGP